MAGRNRPGQGRKPSEATILRRRIIENKIEEAEASFAFLVAVRDNEDEPTNSRVEAAKEILDRVIGKARGDDMITLRGAIVTQDVNRLSESDRRARIAELLERRGRIGTASTT